MSKPILPLPGTFIPQQPQQLPQGQLPGGSPPQQPAQQKPTYSKRGKITIVACVPCRKRKTKCDGKRPECTQCQSREGACHYDMSEEQRRLTYLRENVEHLAEEKNTLEALIWNLRSSSEEEAAEILRRLRTGTDPQTLANHIQASRSLAQVSRDNIGPSDTSPSSVHSLIDPSILPNAGQPPRAEQLESLVNTIVASSPVELDEIARRLKMQENIGHIVSAARGGTLLQPLMGRDVDMQSALESEYPSHEHSIGLARAAARAVGDNSLQSQAADALFNSQISQWTTVTDDQDFIHHLISVYFAWQHPFFQTFPEHLFREDMAAGRANYCSRFLVNAICAAGSLLSTHPKVRREPNDPRSADLAFYDEALRLLRDEQATSTTTAAGLFLLGHVESYRGRLSVAWGLCGQSARMALDLNLHLKSDKPLDTMDAKLDERARAHTLWGSFIADQVTSFTLSRLPQIPVNSITIDLPMIIPEEDDEPWIAYGTNLPARPGYRSTTFHEVASLSKIVNSTLLMFFAPSQSIKGSILLDEYEKYQTWFRRLPSSVASIENAPPHVLCLHMYYQTAVLMLFRPFLKAKFTDSDLSPSEVCRQAANQISNIFDAHRQLYDTTGIYTFQLHCLLTACTIHIVNLPTQQSAAYLTGACNHFHDLVALNEWATGSLAIIKGLVKKWNVILPQECELALYRNHASLSEPAFLDDSTGPQAELFRPQKRIAFLPPPTESAQKRQKLSHSSDGAGVKVESGGNGRDSQNQQPNYLFAPFPNQPAPLLAPIHTSTSTSGQWADELNEVARGFDGLKFEGDSLFDPFTSFTN